MFNKKISAITLGLFLINTNVAKAETDISMLRATIQNLQQQNKALEKRLSDLETRLGTVSAAAQRAQATADSAQASANSASSYSHSAGFFPHISQVIAQHGGCSGSDTSSPACHAAAHRYCASQGYTSGLITEFDGTSVFVGCFR
jgi:TolA-binding protein